MKAFLTSSPCAPGEGVTWPISRQNGLLEELKRNLPQPCKALFIASSPDEPNRTEQHAFEMKASFEESGIVFSEYVILDRRNQEKAGALLSKADFVVLAGGHVPTQNDFFQDIALRELMKDYDGLVMGISAGTMNSAELVYVHPEKPGETRFRDEERYRPGLGLCKTMVLPHLNMIRYDVLDGKRLFEDVAYVDSRESGRDFYALPDGSWIYVHDGVEELRGEAWRIHDGTMSRISKDGETHLL